MKIFKYSVSDCSVLFLKTIRYDANIKIFVS